jgi:hypothetical protein
MSEFWRGLIRAFDGSIPPRIDLMSFRRSSNERISAFGKRFQKHSITHAEIDERMSARHSALTSRNGSIRHPRKPAGRNRVIGKIGRLALESISGRRKKRVKRPRGKSAHEKVWSIQAQPILPINLYLEASLVPRQKPKPEILVT